MRGLEQLGRVKGELAGDGSDRGRLRAAACEFYLAARSSEGWPLRFRLKADMVSRRLGGCDDVEQVIAGMSEAEARAAADDLRLLCDEAERAARGFAEA